MAYLKDAPQYGEASNDEIAAYHDKIISCSSDVKAEHKQYLEYQLQQQVKTCRIRNTQICKFGFPIPPMQETMVLEPIQFESKEEAVSMKNGVKYINTLKNSLR